MFLAFGAASVVFLSSNDPPQPPHPTPPPPQTFLIYMELSLLSFGPGTEPTLKCNEYNLEKKKKMIVKGEPSLLEAWGYVTVLWSFVA